MRKLSLKPSQLNLPFYDTAFCVNEQQPPKNTAVIVKEPAKDNTQKTLEYLNNLTSNCPTLQQLLLRLDIEILKYCWHFGSFYHVDSLNRLVKVNMDYNVRYLEIESPVPQNDCFQYEKTIVFVNEDLNLFKATLSIVLDKKLGWCESCNCLNFSMSEWEAVKKIKFCKEYHFLQDEETLEKLVAKHNPYAYQWLHGYYDVRSYLLAPYLEILDKAGYSFVNQFCRYDKIHASSLAILNRLCKTASKPKDIFKTDKAVFSVLKNERDLSLWDNFRKLYKFGRINADNVRQLYQVRADSSDLDSLNSILSRKYNGKAVFSLESLLNYLNRVDTFEAIEKKEALMLLKDYLYMCEQLDMKPRIDGDSLKREHDVAARNVRNMRNEQMTYKLTSACNKMSKYDYEENIFFIRAIKSYDDLLDEAKQQHNCVASYSSRIAEESSYIYVMREVAKPNSSLITVELSPKKKQIVQKFLAYNQPIRNKAQSEFLERWLKHVRSIA